jgi:hypothetical protein
LGDPSGENGVCEASFGCVASYCRVVGIWETVRRSHQSCHSMAFSPLGSPNSHRHQGPSLPLESFQRQSHTPPSPWARDLGDRSTESSVLSLHGLLVLGKPHGRACEWSNLTTRDCFGGHVAYTAMWNVLDHRGDGERRGGLIQDVPHGRVSYMTPEAVPGGQV